MKKWALAMLTCLSFAFACAGLVACGDDDKGGNSGNSGNNEQTGDFRFSLSYEKGNASYAGVCLDEYLGTDENVVIPDTYNGEPVVAIGPYVFSDKYVNDGAKIKSIVMPDTVTTIERNAFYQATTLESVTFSNSLEYLGQYAFGECTALKSIELPSSVQTIESRAFTNCSNLKTVEVSEGVTSIGEHAFASCYSLQTIEIPEGVTSIGSYAFYDDRNLMQAILPSTATLGENIFSWCYKLVEIVNASSAYDDAHAEERNRVYGNFAENVLQYLDEKPTESNFIEKDGVVFYDKQGEIYLINYVGEDKRVTPSVEVIGEKTFTIRDYAFWGSNAKYVDTTSYATAIGSRAFNESNLLRLVIGENVTSFDVQSYSTYFGTWNSVVELINLSGITALEEKMNSFRRNCGQYLTYMPSSNNFFEEDGCTYYTKGGKTYLVDIDVGDSRSFSLPKTNFSYVLDVKVPWNEKVTVPNCVQFEKAGFFSSYFSSSQEIVLEEGITEIPERYFTDCSILRKVSIPNSMKTIGKNAFSAQNLEYFEKDGNKYLGNENNPQVALMQVGDTSATEMTFGGNIKVVADGVLEQCSNLSTVYWFLSADPTEQIFGESFANITFKYHNISASTTSYAVPEGITTLQYKHLEGATSIKELVIPATVTEIESGALKDLTSLEKLTLPLTGTNKIKVFGELFGVQEGGVSQSYLGSVERAYAIPTSLTEVTVLDGKVSDWFFNGCKNITTVNFADMTEIGMAAFEDTGIVSLTLTDKIAVLGNSAFANCANLKTVVLPKTATAFVFGNATTVGAMFLGCSALEELTLPDVLLISTQTFDNISGLTVYYYNDFQILDALADTPTYVAKEDCFSNVTFSKIA